MNRKFMNGSSSPNKTSSNRMHVGTSFNNKNECWSDLGQFQSEQYNNNQTYSSRKQQPNRFQSIKSYSSSKPYNKNGSNYFEKRGFNNSINNGNMTMYHDESTNDSIDSGVVVNNCLPAEQFNQQQQQQQQQSVSLLNQNDDSNSCCYHQDSYESTPPSSNSPSSSSSSSSSSSPPHQAAVAVEETSEDLCFQQQQQQQPQQQQYHYIHPQHQMVEMSNQHHQICEINCNTSGVYSSNNNNNNNSGLFDYECQLIQTPPPSNQLPVPIQYQQQQQQQHYVYHSYADPYSSPVTPQQPSTDGLNQQQFYATNYQTMPSPHYHHYNNYEQQNNMCPSPFSTPVVQQQQQQQPHILSSPQQLNNIINNNSMFASYQTPPSSNHHQLYLTPASMSPPAQMSPATTFLNDRQSNCNSPHFNSSSFLNTFHQQQQQQQTPNQNSFMMYTNAPPQGSNTTQTNAANAIPNHVTSFQCQSPSQSYLMYQSQHSIQSIQPAQTPPIMYSPYSTSQYSNSPMMSPQINTTTTNNTSSSPSSSLNSPSSSSYSKYNRSGSKPINNRFNNFQKRNFHQKLLNNSNNNVQVSTTTATTMNGGVPTSNIIFSPLESIYLNNPILATQPPGTFDDYLNDEQTHKLIDPNVTVYSPPPPQIYCDINGNLIGLPDNLDNCCGNSFGDETNDYYENNPNDYDYDNNNNNNNNDSSHVSNDNDEMLACTICRGRRMCFCYFLKVRYYKFPSFFDLVDHQYKKWRASLAKAKKAI